MTLQGESKESKKSPKVEVEKPVEKMPAAGPHARPELTNFDACPGSGVLPSEQELGGETDPGAG